MKYYGFNFQWMFAWEKGKHPLPPDEKALDFLAETGFNFVRIPTDYRFWTQNFDYLHPDTDVFLTLDSYLAACKQRDIHLSLNLHRAPGYCINRNDLEKDNLWLDPAAQEGFIFIWETFARRYSDISSDFLSFDLINEPPEIGQYGLTRENHAALIQRTVQAIHAIHPQRTCVIDGLGGGHLAMPELADLGAIHSGRGYQPMTVSHYGAFWWKESEGFSPPVYPGSRWNEKIWDRSTIEEFYQPWLEVQKMGVPIHIGEFGCFNQTPNPIALRWFQDILSLYQKFHWGYSLWQFSGPFGIVDHGRPDAIYEDFHGFRVDRKLLDMLLKNRTAD